MIGTSPSSITSIWFLTGQVEETGSARRIPINTTPFRIGRQSHLSLCLSCRTVSGQHAEILAAGDGLALRDLNSTNGTYVNGQRVAGTVPIHSGDIVQFANLVFRLQKEEVSGHAKTCGEDVCDLAVALVQFDKLISGGQVVPFFQPIVDINTKATVGYEALGRSFLFGLRSPQQMFAVASQLNLEGELSRVLRREEVRAGWTLPQEPHLFLNTHPVEIVDSHLTDSLRAVRELAPEQPITLEVHEAAVTDPAKMGQLRSILTDLKIGLAFDDFGAGQSRLIELTEVRPDYLKFDLRLVRGIDSAPASRQQMLAHLVRMTHELEIASVAEGVETPSEADACRQLGFVLGQGYYFGKPAPAKGQFVAGE